MTTIEVKTITKYVVDGKEFDTEQEANDYLMIKDMTERLDYAFMKPGSRIDNDTHHAMQCDMDEVVKLFALAGYEIKDVRGGE